LTTLSRNTVTDNIKTVVRDYFSASTGKFDQSFRRSNLLTLIDANSPAILSSRMSVKMQRRFTPTLTAVQAHTLRYAAALASPDDSEYIIQSTGFKFRNKNCILRNRLGSNKLEVFNLDDTEIIIDNVGDYTGDTVRIVGLQVDEVSGSRLFIKLSAIPANQSVLTPFRQDIVEHDESRSFARIVDVEPGVTN
jgi:hypothetical protein